MDFFKSVFSDPTPSPSLTSTPNSPDDAQTTSPPETDPPSNPWEFGSTLFSAIASKSETLLDNYYKDIQEFSSGLKKETSVIRQAASQAVQNFPSRLESGAAIAQESLEAVGQAIDNVGSSVSEIIAKDLNLASQRSFFGAHFDQIGVDVGDSRNYGKDSGFSENVIPYSRIDAMVRSLQCSVKTYCEEVEDSDYIEWKMGFRLVEKGGEIERLVEGNVVIREIYDEVVPKKVDEETFWCLYFYKVQKVIEAEEARARFVKRAIVEEEEELSWDVDDNDNDDNDSHKGRAGFELKDELNKEIEDHGKKVQTLQLKSGEKGVERDAEDEAGVSGSKGENSAGEESVEERLKSDDKEGSEGKIESDFSVVSSQRFDEDYVGWDEIEAAFGSGDEGKITDHGSSSTSNLADLRKRLSAAEQDEELTWDMEDDDDKHIKS